MRFKEYKTDLKLKSSEQMERHFKGMANHHRIDILLLIDKASGINVEGIADGVKGNFKTISQHIRHLVHSGLVNKKYFGQSVSHFLTPYGKVFVTFIKEFKKISIK